MRIASSRSFGEFDGKATISENRIHRMEGNSSLQLLWSDLFLLTGGMSLQFGIHPHHGKNANARIRLQK